MTPTRRDFLKAAGTTAAGSMLAAQSEGQRKIGYCIVGLGRISMNQFMPGVQLAQKSKLVALVSGSREKAEKQADKYGVSRKNIYSYQNYDAIAENPEIDAVYIALPNNMHAEYTIRAARAGKHVLCEKPIANSPAEAEQMIAECRKAKRKLMVAYRCQFEPTHQRAIKMIREGQIGELRVIESCFGFNIRAGEWRLNKQTAGGGPMVDVGVYSLQACRYLSGQEPTEIHASWSVISKDGRFTEVEENLVWDMRFPSGVLAYCATSYGAGIGNRFRAMGTRGWVQMEPAFSYEGLRIRYQLQGQQPIEEAADDPAPRQFTREADYFSGCILDNRELDRASGDDGVRDQKLIAAIYRSCAERRYIQV